jgi:hypothetical protein
VFEDIGWGTAKRALVNAPGLIVQHLMKFFDGSLCKAFDNGHNVRPLSITMVREVCVYADRTV